MNDELTLPPHGKAPRNVEAAPDRLPCKWCAKPTLRETLAHYGARCLECYESYVRQPQPSPEVGDQRANPKSWAYALKTREESGDRLTQAQRTAWRGAIKTEVERERDRD